MAEDSGLPGAPPATLAMAVSLAEERLEEAGVAEAIADSRLLLARAAGVSPTWLFAHSRERVPEAAWSSFCELVARRRRREPLQHLLGEQEFWSLRLIVGPAVLVPRPETEGLVEACLRAVGPGSAPRIADVGTGSGALAIALASELPGARLVATDVSPEALDVASANAIELGWEAAIEFAEGELLEPLAHRGPFDAVVANLPYVSAEEWETLEPEVRDHDPRLALVGGEVGTELILSLIQGVPEVLVAGGWLGLEVGEGQAAVVAGALAERGFEGVEIDRDLAGIERIVSGRWPG